MLCKLADSPEIASRKELMDKEVNLVEGEREEAATVAEGNNNTNTATNKKKLEDEELVANQIRNSPTEAMVEGVGGQQQQPPQKAGGLALPIPPDFRCPLSLELMSDPVIVASGQTYEKAYIQQWLDEGNTTCPKTRQTLSHTNLIPNYTVKALIANWCEANNVPLPEPAKIDTLNTILRPITPLINSSLVKAEPEERRVDSPSPPRPLHEPIVIPEHRPIQERSMSGIGSRPHAKSRRTFQPRSFDDREFERNGVQNQNGGDEPHHHGGGEASQQISAQSPVTHHLDGDVSLRRISLLKEKYDPDSGNESSSPLNHHHNHHNRTGSGSSVASSVEDVHGSFIPQEGVPIATTSEVASHTPLDSSPYQSDVSGEMERLCIASAVAFPEESGSPSRPLDSRMSASWKRRSEDRGMNMPRIVPSPMEDSLLADGNAQQMVEGLVLDLESDDVDVQRQAAAELRLLAKFNMENRIVIANSGAIRPLVALLRSTDPKTQENAVTALLNLSINDNNKSEIASAGAIDPLVNVLRVGNAQAMENAAATLFSLSVMDDNKVTIGASGAIPPLVHLLINGTPRGKKDAATALFNLSIFHENKARIVRAGAIKPLVELMADPAAGMVDKAVAVLANLATIPEGRVAVGDESGIPALVEVVEAGSQRGKENAAAALLQLCMNSNKHRALVLQEGAIPPLVALSQSGTARAKEKASALLRHFREQRHQVLGPRPGPDRHMGQY